MGGDLVAPASALRRSGATCVITLLVATGVAARAQDSSSALRFYGTGVGPPGQQDRVLLPVDDNVAGANSSPIDIGAGSFTVEWWMRGVLTDNDTTNAGGDIELNNYSWIDGNIVLDRDIWCGSSHAWGVSLAGGFVRFGVDSGSGGFNNTIEGDVLVLDDAWHHVAVVRDASQETLSIVVDGQLDFSGWGHATDLSYPDAGVPVTPGQCGPGQLTPYGWYLVLAAEKHDAGAAYPSYSGFLDELRIWDVARTPNQIAGARFDVLGPTPGLVGLYRFEEGSGTVVGDSSGNGSPDGELVAGLTGNGEWVLRSDDPANTAPVAVSGLIFRDGFESGDLTAW